MTALARDLEAKCFAFAVDVVKLSERIAESRKEWILSRQIAKSGTSIGANYREAQYAQTKPDFIAKVSIALKEAGETRYWLDLLVATGYASSSDVQTLQRECDTLIASFTRIIKTAKSNPNR